MAEPPGPTTSRPSSGDSAEHQPHVARARTRGPRAGRRPGRAAPGRCRRTRDDDRQQHPALARQVAPEARGGRWRRWGGHRHECSSAHRQLAQSFIPRFSHTALLPTVSRSPPRVPLVIRLVGYTIGVWSSPPCCLIPALFFGDGEATPNYEDTSITSYVADFDVDDDGDLEVTETITVDFPGYGKHGIFRFWDRVDPNDRTRAATPRTSRSPATAGRAVRAELRGPRPLPGRQDRVRRTHARHRRARLRDQLPHRRRDHGGHGGHRRAPQFFWQLIPGGWQQSIDEAHLTVHLPVESESDVQCAIGFVADRPAARRRATAPPTSRRHRPDRRPDAGPIATGLDMADPESGNALPWTARWDRSSDAACRSSASCCCSAAAPAVGGIAGARSREKPPGFPLLYAPPDGIGPAQAKYIFSETVDRETYVATLMYAAEKDAVDLDPRRRHLDHQTDNGPGRLGRPRPGHPRQRPPPRRPGLARSPRTRRTSRPGSGSRRARALRQQRRDLGEVARATWSAAGSAARRPARPRRLRRVLAIAIWNPSR